MAACVKTKRKSRNLHLRARVPQRKHDVAQYDREVHDCSVGQER